ncbi:MAG TPA: oligosaccharide flippase family protein [Bacteroidota bacterium]|nr:oligosaccharide flippase family protein [Bacteroidota bacterium]
MFSQIKRLGADTAIYGISTIVGRFLTFLLVPFYTNVLSTSEYGIVANVYSYLAFLNVLYNYGMESAYFRYASALEGGDPKERFSTPFFSILATSALFSGCIFVFATPLTHVFLIRESLFRLLRYSAGILFFDAIVIVPFASLRLAHRPRLFALLKIINIASNVAFNIISIVWLKWGIEGIFLSGFASSALTFVLLVPHIVRSSAWKFSFKLFGSLLRFGLPYVPVGLSGMVLQVIDRPMLKAITNDSNVGVYQANYRLGIFMNLVTSMFDYAWKPFFLSHAKDPDAKTLYSRIMTYFLVGMCGIFLAISFFITDLVKIEVYHHHLIHPDYWGGLGVVPVVLLAYIFGGISIHLNAGIFIEKKTAYLLPTSILAAVSNVVANYFLIPIYGIMGAAYATLIAYALGAISLFLIVQRFYPIRYEYARIFKVALSVAIVYGAELVLGGRGGNGVALKALVLCLWPLFLFAMRFFDKGEIAGLGRLFRIGTHPAG